MNLMRPAVLTIFLAAVSIGGETRANEALDGYWMDSDGEVILDIRPCGNAHCGRVAWLRLPNGPDGKELLDYRNPDPQLRERPVCGLDVVTGFKRQPDGTWGEGTVYVSDLGASFSGNAEILNPEQVKVTGYIGIALFGKSEIWSRVKTEFELCWTKPGAKAAALVKDGAPSPPAKAAAKAPSQGEPAKPASAAKPAAEQPAAQAPPREAPTLKSSQTN